jgi:hypothetical protein
VGIDGNTEKATFELSPADITILFKNGLIEPESPKHPEASSIVRMFSTVELKPTGKRRRVINHPMSEADGTFKRWFPKVLIIPPAAQTSNVRQYAYCIDMTAYFH